jgi:hypothetical protein
LSAGEASDWTDAGDVAASAVQELPGTVLKAQDQTAETLARLEQTTDRLALAPYPNWLRVVEPAPGARRGAGEPFGRHAL